MRPKRNAIVTIIMRAILDQEVSIMKQLKVDKSLTIRAWLNSSLIEPNETCFAGKSSIVAMATSLLEPRRPPVTARDIAFLPGTTTLEQPLGTNGVGSTKCKPFPHPGVAILEDWCRA